MAVGSKDVAKTWGDDDADAKTFDGPSGWLTRRPAAEIRPGGEDLCAAEGFAVEDEIQVLCAVRVVAEGFERPRGEDGRLSAHHALNPDDHVGVDVGLVQMRSHAGHHSNGFDAHKAL